MSEFDSDSYFKEQNKKPGYRKPEKLNIDGQSLVHGENLVGFPQIDQVAEISVEDEEEISGALKKLIEENPEIVENAQKDKLDLIAKNTSNVVKILSGVSIAMLTAGIGAIVLYDHKKSLKEKAKKKAKG
jgi:hypothetical protein